MLEGVELTTGLVRIVLELCWCALSLNCVGALLAVLLRSELSCGLVRSELELRSCVPS